MSQAIQDGGSNLLSLANARRLSCRLSPERLAASICPGGATKQVRMVMCMSIAGVAVCIIIADLFMGDAVF